MRGGLFGVLAAVVAGSVSVVAGMAFAVAFVFAGVVTVMASVFRTIEFHVVVDEGFLFFNTQFIEFCPVFSPGFFEFSLLSFSCAVFGKSLLC